MVGNYIDELIKQAVRVGVSDIHFKPNNEQVDIFVRNAGIISYKQTIEEQKYSQIVRYLKYRAKLDLGLCLTPQDGAFTFEIDEREVFIRISIIPLVNKQSVVIRLLYERSVGIISEVNDGAINYMYQTIITQNGLFVFTGPTGSGKTSSMYKILEKAVTAKNVKVICIEDPVEVIQPLFTQIQINEQVGLNYTTALKACLRHDPDIIMIGEIRDGQTAANVVRATLTGHTVISTMHTKNKYGVIARFIDFGYKLSEISSILIGISNQRLVVTEQGIQAFYDYVVDDELMQLITSKQEVGIYEKLSQAKLSSTKK